jgi:hypothetical protein
MEIVTGKDGNPQFRYSIDHDILKALEDIPKKYRPNWYIAEKIGVTEKTVYMWLSGRRNMYRPQRNKVLVAIAQIKAEVENHKLAD